MISEQHQSYVSTSQYVGNVCDLLKIRQLMLIRTHELLVKALFLYRASSDCTRLICLGSGQHPPPCYSSSTGPHTSYAGDGERNFTEDHRYSSLLDFNFKTLEGSRKQKPKIFFPPFARSSIYLHSIDVSHCTIMIQVVDVRRTNRLAGVASKYHKPHLGTYSITIIIREPGHPHPALNPLAR